MVVSLWPAFLAHPVSLHSSFKLLCQLWWICLQPNATVKKFAIIFPTGIRAIPCPTYVHSYFFSFPICSFIPIPMRFPFPVKNLIPAAISTGADRRPARSNAESESSVDRQCSVDVCAQIDMPSSKSASVCAQSKRQGRAIHTDLSGNARPTSGVAVGAITAEKSEGTCGGVDHVRFPPASLPRLPISLHPCFAQFLSIPFKFS